MMKDETIIRLLEESSSALGEMDGEVSCGPIGSSYNAILREVQRNHPEDEFLRALPPLEGKADQYLAGQIRVLFAQLRIVLEALQS